jgi:hypothetical protein
MGQGLSLPRQYRGDGDLRTIVERNSRAMMTHINQRLIGLEEDGSVNMFSLPLVVLPSVQSEPTKLGFFGATTVVKPTVSGAKGANAALGSLITALSNLGLIVDTTTA